MNRLLISIPMFALAALSLLVITSCSLLPSRARQPTATAELPTPAVQIETLAPPTPEAPSPQPAPTEAPTSPAPTDTVAAPTEAPTAVPTQTPAASATLPALTPPPIKTISVPAARQPINFLPKTAVYALPVNLAAGVPTAYTLNVGAGQHLFFTLNGNAVVQVSRPDGAVIVPPTSRPGPWEVVAGQQGNYIVVLKGVGLVTVGIYIPPASSTSLSAAPLPATLQSISFPQNAISATVTFTLTQGAPQAFTLAAAKGQLVSAIVSGNATLSFLSPDGSLLLPTLAIPGQWQFALPQSGANTLVFIGQGQVTLTVTIPPAAPPAAAVMPVTRTRASFAAGNAAATFTTTLVSGSPQGYVLTVLGGQRIYIAATGQAQVQVLGPGDTQLKTLGGVGLWAVDAAQTGDYTVVVFGAGPTTLTIYVPPL
jgi:hypothetical protein